MSKSLPPTIPATEHSVMVADGTADTPYKKTEMFAYRGILGIDGGTVTINDPTSAGQLGVIVDGSEVILTQAAFDVLKKIKTSRDAIGDIMVWKAGQRTCVGWLGGRLGSISPDYATGDRDYNPELLRSNIVPDSEIETPAAFIQMVDENLPPQ